MLAQDPFPVAQGSAVVVDRSHEESIHILHLLPQNMC